MTRDDERPGTLGEWAASDEPAVRPGAEVLRGAAARAASRALLEEAAADDAASRALVERSRPGRPPLEEGGVGPSPTWRYRVPRSLDQRMRAQAAAEHRDLSEVLRSAAAEYLEAHAAG
ncbi:MAG: hypothetical protein IE923_16395 [Micrococcales bacterium]|uniref:hypothetical protein n=1 Tax=Cellulomonas sp. P4 TaxID=3142533 RepID=UPI0019904A41|nr:hypothetical protein [Micrococcales bacterium]